MASTICMDTSSYKIKMVINILILIGSRKWIYTLTRKIMPKESKGNQHNKIKGRIKGFEWELFMFLFSM